MTSHRSFGRRILVAFAAMAALTVAILVGSLYSLKRVTTSKDAVVATSVRDALDAERLALLHETRTSELRAFLIARDRAALDRMDAARAQFLALLDEYVGRAETGTFVADQLAKIRSTELAYQAAVGRALAGRSRRDAILEREARPLREEIGTALAKLGNFTRSQLDSAHQASITSAAQTARTATLAIVLLGLVFLGIGGATYRTLRAEELAMTQSREARDILQLARQRAGLLAEAGRILSESAAPKEALGLVASRGVEWLADVFLIELAEGQGILHPAALVVAKTQRAPLLTSLHQNLPRGLGSLFATETLMRTSEPVLRVASEDERLDGLGVKSYIAMPLRARGRALGVLLLARMEESEPYREQDVQFARELGHQTALAIDNARLLQEAEVGMKMREELLATVAHDLKTPLSVVRMTSDLALRDLGESAPLRKAFHGILTAAQEMQRLIHDLLELTQIEAGRIVIDKSPHDALDLIESAVRLVAPQAGAKQIEIVREVRPGECIADCDRNRVLQVLSNLIGNAIKFTAPGGRVRVDAQATGEGIRFSVIDNGPGIPAEQLPHVFERYWVSRRAQQRGTGLGLSIARGLVEVHGGRIWAESAVNIGSRFFFTLPEARLKAAEPEKAA